MKDLEKVSKVSDDCTLTIVELQESYNNWKSVVWVVRIRHEAQGDILVTHGTAFSVSSDGLILPSAHLFPKTSYELDVRRLDEANFHRASVVFQKPKWDVILLQVLDVNGCQYATLTNDGSLSVGQSLLHIGNPDQFVGSFLMGKVAFECIDHVEDLEKVSKVSDDCTLTIVELQESYNNWKSVVWVVRIRHEAQGDILVTHGTAFSVSSDGLILTSAHLFPKTSYELDVRRLDEANFHRASVVFQKPKWDVILLQVLDVNGCQYATLTNDGSLSVGQSLLHIGNPDQFVESFLMGKVAFECIDHVEVHILLRHGLYIQMQLCLRPAWTKKRKRKPS